jgi:hypothetical protein
LERLDSSIQSIAFRDQKHNNLFSLHYLDTIITDLRRQASNPDIFMPQFRFLSNERFHQLHAFTIL